MSSRHTTKVIAHNPNCISIGSAVFCTDDHTVSLYFTMGCPFKIALSHGEIRTPPFSTWFSGPTESSTQRASRSVQLFFARLTSVTDRPTGHTTRWIIIGLRTYVVPAMRPKMKKTSAKLVASLCRRSNFVERATDYTDNLFITKSQQN